MLEEDGSEAPPWQRAEVQYQMAQFATLQRDQHPLRKVNDRGVYFGRLVIGHRRQVEETQRETPAALHLRAP